MLDLPATRTLLSKLSTLADQLLTTTNDLAIITATDHHSSLARSLQACYLAHSAMHLAWQLCHDHAETLHDTEAAARFHPAIPKTYLTDYDVDHAPDPT